MSLSGFMFEIDARRLASYSSKRARLQSYRVKVLGRRPYRLTGSWIGTSCRFVLNGQLCVNPLWTRCSLSFVQRNMYLPGVSLGGARYRGAWACKFGFRQLLCYNPENPGGVLERLDCQSVLDFPSPSVESVDCDHPEVFKISLLLMSLPNATGSDFAMLNGMNVPGRSL
jgi:hypothetical protein